MEIEPVSDALVTLQHGRHCIEVKVPSKQLLGQDSWVVTRRVVDKYVTHILEQDHTFVENVNSS